MTGQPAYFCSSHLFCTISPPCPFPTVISPWHHVSLSTITSVDNYIPKPKFAWTPEEKESSIMDITAGAGKPTERKQCQTYTTWTHSLLFLWVKVVLCQRKGTGEHIQEQISKRETEHEAIQATFKTGKCPSMHFCQLAKSKTLNAFTHGILANEECTFHSVHRKYNSIVQGFLNHSKKKKLNDCYLHSVR